MLSDSYIRFRALFRRTAVEVREVLQNVDAQLVAEDVKTLAEQMDQSLDEEKLICTVSGCFGALALVLACIGLYGVMRIRWRAAQTRSGCAWRWGPRKAILFGWSLGKASNWRLPGC